MSGKMANKKNRPDFAPDDSISGSAMPHNQTGRRQCIPPGTH